MSFYPVPSLGSRFTSTLQTLRHSDTLAFAQTLAEPEIQQASDAEGLQFATGANDIYTPALTAWACLQQALSSCQSCVAAVARILVLRAALELPPCSAATGGYCKARAKLTVAFWQRLTYQVGTQLEDQAPDAWRWHQRRTLVVDGLETPLPDTPANQKAYPQPPTQKPGLGFPLLRIVVLLTFATAALVGAAYGPHQGKETGETVLFRQLLERLRPGDVVVADRYYCSYFLIALLQEAGVDVAFRLHQRRHYDFRRGRRLGRDDHVVAWTKPARPAWMDEATYARLPATLSLREIRFRPTQRGCRSQEIVVATTLRDADAYPKRDLEDLYHARWHVELDIRSIKHALRLEYLRCLTPAMIERELWAHFLGYNVIRRALAQAAWTQGLCPRQLSFAGGLQTLEAFRWLLRLAPAERHDEIRWLVSVALATHQVANRPDRCEPRKVKRRPKQYGLLTKPRAEARAELLGGKKPARRRRQGSPGGTR